MNKWHILPGMGASSAMYNALRHMLDFDVNYINWPHYGGEKTYKEVAQTIIKNHRIANGDVIGGSSLGGMVALEIGRLVQPRAIILIGSAMTTNEVQGLLTLLSPLATFTPVSVIQALIGKHKNLVSSMFADADPEFIRAMCMYLQQWPGYTGKADIIYRLHGKQDHVIPCPMDGATVVENAGHLIAMTHVAETAAFMQKVRALISAS
jgi:hypothetical protein